MTQPKLHFRAALTTIAQMLCAKLSTTYGNVAFDACDVVVAIGGDGFMLETLHDVLGSQKPVYGLMTGSIGFLMNQPSEGDLMARIQSAKNAKLHPLCMRAHTMDGGIKEAFAINEVSILRQTRQAAKVAIYVDGVARLEELICDGLILSTPAGSTAYNLSAHGPILPIGANVMALTPISAFRPRRWRGAVLSQKVHVEFKILEADKRPVSAVADSIEVRDIVSVSIQEDRSKTVHLLFDKEHNLEERILNEQFTN